MRSAAVGFQCPSCVAEGSRETRSGRAVYGGARSGNPARTSQVLIALNLAVYLLLLATGASRSPLLYRLALLPREGVAIVDGIPQRFPGVADGAYWQLLTSAFTHVQIWHIGFNMVALWVLGPQLEAVLGRARFLTVYLVSALAGSALVYWLAPEHSVTVGASGALFGLMAALLVVAVKVRGDVQGLLVLVAVNAAITAFGHGFISWQGHLGGFVGGVVLALVLVYAPRAHRTAWQVTGMTVVGVGIVASVVLRTLMLT